jgi:putative transcription factor
MMLCEICGEKEAQFKIKIDLAIMEVCKSCADFEEKVPVRKKRKNFFITDDFELKENFGEIIRAGRVKKGLSVEQLAKQLGEKESVLLRIEAGKLYPSTEMTKKLEKILKIDLKAEFKPIKPVKSEFRHPTIGDIAKVKE